MAAVASSLLAPLLAEDLTDLEILGTSSQITWFKLNGKMAAIQLVAPGSIKALPISIFLPAGTMPTSSLELRQNQLWLAGVCLDVCRWWLPPRAPLTRYQGPYGSTPAVDELIGRGKGLTPEGDDLIAGWLVMARAIGHPGYESVWAEVQETATARTTSFSTALLDCAGKGFGIAVLIDYVNARLANDRNAQLMKSRLERVGDTSGKALALGVDLAIDLIPNHFDPIQLTVEERANA